MFTYKIEPIIKNRGADIGGKYTITKSIGTFRWSWTDNKGQLHTKKLNNVISFPDSPVNILSATALAKSIKDNKVTLVQKIKYYIFN